VGPGTADKPATDDDGAGQRQPEFDDRDGIPVANISKRWFRVRESYGVAVAPGQDDALVLAITVCIDHLVD
jgi:uncharacterized protein YxjI